MNALNTIKKHPLAIVSVALFILGFLFAWDVLSIQNFEGDYYTGRFARNGLIYMLIGYVILIGIIFKEKKK